VRDADGGGLSRLWSHDRAHWFFARARWSADDLGLAVAKLVVALLVPPGAPVVVAIDDTLFRRRGKKVWAASWFHDGSAQGPAKTGYGNNWVVAGIVCRLPMVRRPVAIPVLAKLVIKDTNSASRLWLARRMADMLAGALPGREIRVVADSAYAGKELRNPGPGITWTTLLRKDAALFALPPARTGRRGAPRKKGDRLPSVAKLAAIAEFTQVTVTRYGKTAVIEAAAVSCLWYSVFGTRPVTVVLIRDKSRTGYDLALVTTDAAATAAAVIERYAARWSAEVAIEDAKQAIPGITDPGQDGYHDTGNTGTHADQPEPMWDLGNTLRVGRESHPWVFVAFHVNPRGTDMSGMSGFGPGGVTLGEVG